MYSEEDEFDDYWQEGDVDGNRIEVAKEDDASTYVSETATDEACEHPYSTLTPEVIIDAVESTGRLSDARILALNSYENRVYQVGIEGDQPIIAKFYRPERWSEAQIQEEHDFSQHLASLDIPVVAPIFDDNGRSIHRYGDFMFSLSPRQGGRAPELDNLEHLKQLGQFIGRIHAAGTSFPFSHRVTMSVESMAHQSVSYLLRERIVPEDLIAAYEVVANQLLQQLETLSLDQFAKLSLHGDCHPGNVLWRSNRPHFVDFDDAITGPAIQDLWMLLSGDTQQRSLQLHNIVEGYEAFMPFDQSELRLVEPLRAMRVLHYNAWLARRWQDPAFPMSFPWFNSHRYWSEHILELKELLASMQEPALELQR